MKKLWPTHDIVGDCWACEYGQDAGGTCVNCLLVRSKEGCGCIDGFFDCLEVCINHNNYDKCIEISEKIMNWPMRKD